MTYEVYTTFADASGEPRMTAAVVCVWCKTVIRPGTQPVSHGICLACKERLFP